MDLDEDISTSPVSSLLENEIPSPLDDCVHARSYIGLVGIVSGIGAEMIYSNLNYTIPGKGKKEAKQIIKNCSGFMRPGVNAILGPTGSGKTTLLGMLAGRTNKDWMEGDIFLDGKRRKESFRLQCGFVVQDDAVMGTLTVRENLAFSAALRLPPEFTDSDRKVRVEQIIKDLELSQCADTKVGTDERRGVSEGERKRTSIGMELIISPEVLFLDEPTTGLDATAAFIVVKLLKRQAKQGRTVIFSIRQPRYSIFKLFDTLTLLSNGETVYHGPCDKSLKYFEAIGYQCETYNNPADHYINVIKQHGAAISTGSFVETQSKDEETICENERTVEVNETLVQLYQTSTYYLETCLRIQPVVDSFEKSAKVQYMEDRPAIDYQSSFWRQTKFVSRRIIKNLFRDKRTLTKQVLPEFIYAFIIGGLFFQLERNEYGLSNRNGMMYFLITHMGFSNLSALAVFLDERRIFRSFFVILPFQCGRCGLLYYCIQIEIRRLLLLVWLLRRVYSERFLNILNNRRQKFFLLIAFRHEIACGYYRVSSYFISKVFCDLVPMRLFPLLICSSITYFMVGLQLEVSKFFIYTLLLFLTRFSTASACLLISSSVELLAHAKLCVSVPLIFMLMFSGFLIRIKDLPSWLQWLKYLSFFRYGLSGLQLNEFENMTFTGCGGANNTCISGNRYLSEQNLKYPWGIVESITVLASVSVTFLLLSFVQLHRMKKIKQYSF